MSLLLDPTNPTRKEKNAALTLAVVNGQEDVVSLFLDHGLDINTTSDTATDEYYGMTALILAASRGHSSVMSLLLDREAIASSTCN